MNHSTSSSSSGRGGKTGKRPATYLTAAERDAFLSGITDPRDRAILTFFALTGLRRNELRMLDRADVNAITRVVSVRFGKGGKFRQVPLSRRVLVALDAYLATRTDASPILFPGRRGGRIAPASLWRILNRYTAEAEAQFGKRLRLHSLRHTCLTALHNGTKDLLIVKAVAGHSDIRTSALYVHTEDEAIRRAMEEQ
jgi:integrase/recombinase XerC